MEQNSRELQLLQERMAEVGEKMDAVQQASGLLPFVSKAMQLLMRCTLPSTLLHPLGFTGLGSNSDVMSQRTVAMCAMNVLCSTAPRFGRVVRIHPVDIDSHVTRGIRLSDCQPRLVALGSTQVIDRANNQPHRRDVTVINGMGVQDVSIVDNMGDGFAVCRFRVRPARLVALRARPSRLVALRP